MFYDTHMKYASFLIVLVILCGVSSVSAFAETADPCAIISEEIIDLVPPAFDKPLRFKRTYGVEGEDRLVKILPLADQGFMAVGITIPVTKSNQAGGALTADTKNIYLNRHDKSGKLIWEKRHAVKNLQRVADAVVIKDQIIIAADVGEAKDSKILLFTVNGLGEKLAEDIIQNANTALSARAMVGFSSSVMIAATAQTQKNNASITTTIIRRSLKGQTLFERDYLADSASQIHALKKLKDGTILAVGRARIASARQGDRMGGWMLKLSERGDIISSDLFPRGRQAEFNDIEVLNNGSLMLVGQVIGTNTGGDMAGWVMNLPQDSSTPLWQSYIKGSYAYEALKILPLNDGRAQILLSAKALAGKESAGRDHARVITYTPEGRMVDVESFIEGSQARPRDFVRSGEFRILAGGAQTGFSNADQESLAFRATFDAWLAGLPLPKDMPSVCASSIQNLTLTDEP